MLITSMVLAGTGVQQVMHLREGLWVISAWLQGNG